jgi:hypothetical protein
VSEITASRKNLAEVVEEVLEAESLVIGREKQLAAATMRIKDLEGRLQEIYIFPYSPFTTFYLF